MKRAILLSLTALTALATATAGLAQTWPREPTPADARVRPLPIPMQTFPDYALFFAHVAQARNAAGAVPVPPEEIEARSVVDHLRDPAGRPIVIVKIGLRGADGNFPFYVLREVPTGLKMLGQMAAVSYEASASGGLLNLVADVSGRPQARYQIDGEFLVDLADVAALDRNTEAGVPVELDVKHGF